MLEFMSAKEAAEKWGISQRRVSVLCSEKRIPDARMLGNMWIIPREAEKPFDARQTHNIGSGPKAHPFVKWAGGKSQLLTTLYDNLPEGFGGKINKYAEPFVGGGALLFGLLSDFDIKEIYVNDINKELINAYEAVQSDCVKLTDRLMDIQDEYGRLDLNARQDYFYGKRVRYNSLNINDESKTEKAALFIFLNKTCFNGLYRVNKSGLFNVPVGSYKNPLICDAENLKRISKLLQNVTIESKDFHACRSFIDSETFVYLDPPYRPLNDTSCFTSYNADSFDDRKQTELAEFFREMSSRGAKVMLSNSDPKNSDPQDDFFENLYDGYDVKRVEAKRMINSNAVKRGKINELLIKNY